MFEIGQRVRVFDYQTFGDSDFHIGTVTEQNVDGPDTWEIQSGGPFYRVRFDGDPIGETFAYCEDDLTEYVS